MSKTLTKELFGEILADVVSKLEKRQEELNRLDAAIGDGDHGTSIVKAMRAAAEAIQEEGSFKDTLYNAGFAAESQDCGSTSSLTGSFYEGMSEAVTSEEMDTDGVIRMFSAALACVEKSTKAQVGDKTLMDALIPAVNQMKSMIDCNASLAEVFGAAADAAQFGAESTVDYVAKFGRSKNLGERTKGHIDPGAVSMAIVFRAFAEKFKSDEESQEKNS